MSCGPLGTRRIHRRQDALSVPRGYSEYEYPSFANDFGATTYIIGFHNRRGARRVVMIDIRTARNATEAGARVSTPVQRLRKKHGVPCTTRRHFAERKPDRCYLGPSLRRAHTVFVIGEELIAGRPTVLKVARIIVRESDIPVLGRL